jgi:hypothetical protein
MSAQQGYYFELFHTKHTCATQIVAHNYVHVRRSSRKYTTFILVWYDHCTYWYKSLILDETKMNNFLTFLFHPCNISIRGSRVLEEIVELITRPLFTYGCKRIGPRFFVKANQRGCRWPGYATPILYVGGIVLKMA